MKFLMFNVVVAVALVYLFTADRAEMRSAADRAFDTAGEIKQMAQKAVGEGRAILDRETVPPVVPRADPAPEVKSMQPVEPPPPPPPPVRTATRPVAEKPLAPEIAARRAEILGPVLKEGERFMSADQRRKELFSLAEEMELLYARKTSR